MSVSFSVCIVVPHYNHSASLQQFLPKLVATQLPCIIVDDGSDAEQLNHLQALLENWPQVTLLRHAQNQGKGAAMITGAECARQQQHTHMLQIDADGQHDLTDVSKFLAASLVQPTAIISGAPQFDESAPKARVYGRKVTDFWVALETWSLQVQDSLCGYRIYPLKEFEHVCAKFHIGRRMDFDTDVLVKSIWLDVPYAFVSTKVVYQAGNASHFHYLRDNLRLIGLHTRLMCGMIARAPFWLARGVSNKFRGGHAETG